MCSQYWNLRAKVTCPKCVEVYTDQLQTHFMGVVNSCTHDYKVGERVSELGDYSGEIEFSACCPDCDHFFQVVGVAKDGRVRSVR